MVQGTTLKRNGRSLLLFLPAFLSSRGPAQQQNVWSCLCRAVAASGLLAWPKGLSLSLLRMATQLVGVCRNQPQAHGAAGTRPGYFTISRPKGGFLMICLSNCSLPAHCLPTSTHHQPQGRPPCSSQLQDKPGCPWLSSCVQGGRLGAPTARQWPRSLVLPRPSQALLEGDKQPSPQRQVLLPIKHEQHFHEKPDPHPSSGEPRKDQEGVWGPCVHPDARLPASFQAAPAQAPAPPAPTLFPWQRRGGPTYCSCSW